MVMDARRLAALSARSEVDLIEVFSSVQGEGPRVGQRHLFVRLVHCDIHCRYCDTPACHAVPPMARLETGPGSRSFREAANPLPLDKLLAPVGELLAATRHHALAITGGEPLLQPHAVEALGLLARRAGVAALLETDGNLPAAYQEVAHAVDVVAMDWKLPSATGEPPRYAEHRRFLAAARGAELYVKAVFTAESSAGEVREVCRAVAELAPGAELVLQPCTPFGRVRKPPPPDLGMRLLELALGIHSRVRLLPQVHPLLGQP